MVKYKHVMRNEELTADRHYSKMISNVEDQSEDKGDNGLKKTRRTRLKVSVAVLIKYSRQPSYIMFCPRRHLSCRTALDDEEEEYKLLDMSMQ